MGVSDGVPAVCKVPSGEQRVPAWLRKSMLRKSLPFLSPLLYSQGPTLTQ